MSKITDPNTFMKIVLVSIHTDLKTSELSCREKLMIMSDYKWEVYESKDIPHSYHVIGNHSTARRLDFYLTKTVIH